MEGNKNNSGSNFFLFLGVTALVGAAVIGIAYVSARMVKLKEVVASLKSIELLGFNLTEGTIGLKLNVNIKNPSDIEVNFTGCRFDVYLNNIFIAPVVYKQPQKIAANTTSLIGLNIYFSPFVILKDFSIGNAKNALGDLKKMAIKVTGYASAQVAGIDVENIPLSTEMPIANLLQ